MDVAQLERHGRRDGELGIVIGFTRSLRAEGDDYKRPNWQKNRSSSRTVTTALASSPKGASVATRSSAWGLGPARDRHRRRGGPPASTELVPGAPADRHGPLRPSRGGLHLWYRAPEGAAKVKVQFAASD